MNTNGVTTSTEQTEYNSLNGSIITAKSITAEKVDVHDLVAFNATIGGFKITDTSIYSGVKNSITNPTRGLHLLVIQTNTYVIMRTMTEIGYLKFRRVL